MQQSEQSAQLSGHVTEANFAVKQYQVHIDEFKEEMVRNLKAQPATLRREVEQALQSYLQGQSRIDEDRRREQERAKMDDLERQRRESELKSQVKRQVESDLKLDFEARIADMQRSLQERDRKIRELEADQSREAQRGASKEAELRRLQQEHEA